MKRMNHLPDPMGLSKKELLDALLKEEYGYLPARPHTVTATQEKVDARFCAGKAELRYLRLRCVAEWGEFSFPVYFALPKKEGKVPCFIHINFRDCIPDAYQPTEELMDMGYATLTFCYQDVTSDNNDFTNGLAGVVYPKGRAPHDCGKIGLWAWAAMAVMDLAQTLPELDTARISVVGHSRLGKTALLTGALDERFYCAFSNDSGCCGAALSRENTGETVERITKAFPFWFCESFLQYANREDSMPFDQHWLIAANLPHKVYVASAVEDLWACPTNEYLSCIAATPYYEANGKRGLVHPDRLPAVHEAFHAGDIGYHLRAGSHYLSREDWAYYMAYLEA